MTYVALALGLLFVSILWIHSRRNRSAIKAERLAMFDECLPLFESYDIAQDDISYPVLQGRYKGYDVTLEPIPDHIAFRTLPSLWLLVTIRGRTPFKGVFDFLRRPKNVEFYSPSSKLEKSISIPQSWPQDAWLRTDYPDRMPPEKLLDPHMSIFEDRKTKELLVTPKGVRIVYQANEAIRSYYMLLRQARFENIMLARDLVQALLDRATALFEDLNNWDSQDGP